MDDMRSWHVSFEHSRLKTLEGATQFLMKNLAWNSLWGKSSRRILGQIS